MILCGEQLTPLENGSLIIEDGRFQYAKNYSLFVYGHVLLF